MDLRDMVSEMIETLFGSNWVIIAVLTVKEAVQGETIYMKVEIVIGFNLSWCENKMVSVNFLLNYNDLLQYIHGPNENFIIN